jgi:group I intron endonuclease
MYIGSSVDVCRRWQEHERNLKNNKHINQYLQNAWNKYGEQNFKFEVIETILIKEKDYILEREQFWLDEHKSYEREKGYNINKIAGSNLGVKFRRQYSIDNKYI